jgi:hypothetical protein
VHDLEGRTGEDVAEAATRAGQDHVELAGDDDVRRSGASGTENVRVDGARRLHEAVF